LENFRARAPDGVVLAAGEPAGRPYGINPYENYDRRHQPYHFFTGDLPERIPALARVVTVDKEAWSLDLIRKKGSLRVAGDIVISWSPGQNSAVGARVIAEGQDVGNFVVQRLTEEGPVDHPYTVDFAFAFHAFYPDAPIHVE